MTAAEHREYKREWARQWRLRQGATPRPTRPYSFDALVAIALERVPEGLNGPNRVGAAYQLLGGEQVHGFGLEAARPRRVHR